MHIKRIHEMVENLTECTKKAIECDEICVGKYPVGDVVDMIKDLCESEYYARCAKKMEECQEEEEKEEEYFLEMLKQQFGDEGRKFYNRYRDSMGRFTSRGRGRRMGYPYPDFRMMPEYYEERDLDLEDGRMYSPIVQGDNRYKDSRYGTSYDEYMRKRKGYSVSDPNQKHERMKLMEQESSEITSMISEMMEDVSPEEKNILKNKLTKLISTI